MLRAYRCFMSRLSVVGVFCSLPCVVEVALFAFVAYRDGLKKPTMSRFESFQLHLAYHVEVWLALVALWPTILISSRFRHFQLRMVIWLHRDALRLLFFRTFVGGGQLLRRGPVYCCRVGYEDVSTAYKGLDDFAALRFCFLFLLVRSYLQGSCCCHHFALTCFIGTTMFVTHSCATEPRRFITSHPFCNHTLVRHGLGLILVCYAPAVFSACFTCSLYEVKGFPVSLHGTTQFRSLYPGRGGKGKSSFFYSVNK